MSASSTRELIVTGSPDLPIAVHDPLTGDALGCFSGSHPPRRGLALVASGNLIAASHIAADTSGFIRLYHWWSSAAVNSVPAPEPVAPLVATLDGSFLFCGGLSGFIHALALPSGDLRRTFRAHRQPVSCLTVNDDGSILISGGDDGTIAAFPVIRVLDHTAADDNDDDNRELPLYHIPAHVSSVTGIVCSSGGCDAIFSSSSLDGTCKLWRVADGSLLRSVQLPCPAWSLVMDPTNSYLYSGGSDGRIYVVDLKAKARRSSKQMDEPEMIAWEATDEAGSPVLAMAMVEENQKLVSASEDGIIRIWCVTSGSLVQAFAHGGSISNLVIARVVAAGSGKAKMFSGDEALGFDGGGGGFCRREMKRKVGETMEMNEQLDVVMKDKSRSIDMFETSIGAYKKLMGLILKAAKKDHGKEDDDPDHEKHVAIANG